MHHKTPLASCVPLESLVTYASNPNRNSSNSRKPNNPLCCLIEQFDMRLESGRGEDALVWALEALSDGTVVSGDSYGRIQVSQKCSLVTELTPGSEKPDHNKCSYDTRWRQCMPPFLR